MPPGRATVDGVMVRDWSAMRQLSEQVLIKRTGEDVEAWNARIAADPPTHEAALRGWLSARGVTGYAQMLLVMERFGYPDFLATGADR